MPLKKPFDLLIECQGCGIENLVPDFTPGVPAICNQCRETLLSPSLADSHLGNTCDNCRMAFLLKKETGFIAGESECQCGGSDFTPLDMSRFTKDLQSAGAYDLADDDDAVDDFDWCRSAPEVSAGDEYNDLFDNDPGIAE